MSDKNKNTVSKLFRLSAGCPTCLVILHAHLFSRELEGSPGYCLGRIHGTTEILHITLGLFKVFRSFILL